MTELTKAIKKAMSGDYDTQFELIYAFAELGYSITIKKFEEEKKMLNIDKYRKEIDLMIENGGMPRYMLLRMCLQKTNLESIDTAEVLDWLFSEYEPPLLENGDGLKPGDWIMARSNEGEEWRERQFAFFHDGWFYCLRGGSNFGQLHLETLMRYEQARLPEDGE